MRNRKKKHWLPGHTAWVVTQGSMLRRAQCNALLSPPWNSHVPINYAASFGKKSNIVKVWQGGGEGAGVHLHMCVGMGQVCITK